MDDAAPTNRPAARRGPVRAVPKRAVPAADSYGARPGRKIATLLVVLGAVVLAVVVVRGSKPDHVAAADTAQTKAVHYSVGISSCTFLDSSRATEDFATAADSAGRLLVTEVRYPTTSPAAGHVETSGATPARRYGPFPLVVFAPGYGTTPDEYSKLLDSWVRAGMVVAAIWFPDTNSLAIARQGGVDTEADIINQPADVGYVTKHLMLASSSGVGCEIAKGLLKTGDVAWRGSPMAPTRLPRSAYETQYAYPGLHYVAVAALSGRCSGRSRPRRAITRLPACPCSSSNRPRIAAIHPRSRPVSIAPSPRATSGSSRWRAVIICRPTLELRIWPTSISSRC